MKTIQVISLDDRPAALIIGDKAIISEHLTARDRIRVQAKAHYALRISAGELPGPYTDQGAEDYARAATTPRTATDRRPRHHRRGSHPPRSHAR